MAKPAIYLDHNATTALDPQARAEMLPWLGPLVGNPSSQHTLGRAARQAVDLARQRVAGLIGAQPEEIVFTSGATEADNLAILGVAGAVSGRRPVVAASAIEHQAVLASIGILVADLIRHIGAGYHAGIRHAHQVEQLHLVGSAQFLAQV